MNIDGNDFTDTDPEYAYLDLANRDYKSLKFDTDEPTLPADGSFYKNYTFAIRAGFNTWGFPEEVKTVIVGIKFSLCKEKTINADTEDKFYPLQWNNGT